MHVFPPSICVATALLGYCGGLIKDPPPPPVFCTHDTLRSMLNDAIYTNTPDKDTQAVKPDAEAIRRNMDDHAAGGGPSSPDNVASFQRFREFVKKKCKGRDIGPSLPEAANTLR